MRRQLKAKQQENSRLLLPQASALVKLKKTSRFSQFRDMTSAAEKQPEGL